MTRNKLEKHLGKKVEVTLFDGTIQTGFLHKTGEESFKNEPNLYIPRNYYFCTKYKVNEICGCLFRTSHIKNLKEIK